MEHKMITELSEDRLDELLTYAPNFTAENLDNIKRRCLQKKAIRHKTGKRTLLAAAITAAVISLSGIALAVSTSFDFGSFYNALFNNPDVEERLEISKTAVSSGLEIALLSAVVDRYQAYVTIEIKDTKGIRLSDSISVHNEAFTDGIHSIIAGSVIYSEAENKATLALTVLYGNNIAEIGTASFSADTIYIADSVIHGSWKISYNVEKAMDNRTLIAYLDNDPMFSKLEVRCSPVIFSVSVTAHGVVTNERGEWTRLVNGYEDMTSSEKTDIQLVYTNEIMEYFFSFELPYLTLTDGSIVVLEPRNDSFDWLGGSSWSPTNYYDIETIQSITFCGETYFFNNTPSNGVS